MPIALCTIGPPTAGGTTDTGVTSMDATFLARGLAVGFTIAAAVGPISILVLRRTLAHGQVYGLASGMGVALADGSYGGIAAFGLTAITSVLVGLRPALGLVGGAFLVYLAIRTMLAQPATNAAEVRERPGLPGAFLSIYGLTMTNPMTILSFAGIFAGLGLSGGSLAEAALLTLGVFLGSATWWVGLTFAVSRLRARLTPTILLWINRLSGGILLVFGLAAIWLALTLVRPA
jgi:threonine/homoserine/homoserine lactone efflux protein